MEKTILVIGGSKGIGNAIVRDLLPHYKVVNISRTEPDIVDGGMSHYSADILEDELPQLDQVDALVYCPGSINLKPIGRLSLEDFKTDYNINVLGAVRSIQAYLPQLKQAENPSILLFSTVASKLGMPFHASIAAAKSAVEGLTKSLAAELAPTIRVNAIAPTVTNTDLASKLLRNDKMKENIKERHPLKTYLEPTDVASMATYLISDKARTITGQVFEMDCGIVSVKI